VLPEPSQMSGGQRRLTVERVLLSGSVAQSERGGDLYRILKLYDLGGYDGLGTLWGVSAQPPFLWFLSPTDL
jgi:hypothetical protein